MGLVNTKNENCSLFRLLFCSSGRLCFAYGLVHTETFSCVFVLFQAMSWLFSIPLRTVNNPKTQENVSVCTGRMFLCLCLCHFIRRRLDCIPLVCPYAYACAASVNQALLLLYSISTLTFCVFIQ